MEQVYIKDADLEVRLGHVLDMLMSGTTIKCNGISYKMNSPIESSIFLMSDSGYGEWANSDITLGDFVAIFNGQEVELLKSQKD